MGWIIERGMVPVNCEIAIFDLKGALAPQDKPLMLQPVLFCPVLTWAAQELMDCGVQRYFIVCPENCRQEVLDDLPGCDVTFFDHAEAALSAAGGDVVMVPGPVVPVYGPEDGRSVYAADSQVLLARLRAGTPLTDCPAEAAGVRSLWRPQALAPAFRPFDSAAALTAAMPDGTGLKAFSKCYPDRFFDVGIAEQHAVTSAAGMAAAGLKPVVAVYSSFLQRGFDQVLHDVCIQNLSVVFALDRAGLVGSDGETHQGIFDLSYLSCIPNMSIMAPKNLWELRKELEFAVCHYDGPIAIRYPRGQAYRGLKEFDAPIEYGKGEMLYEGSRIALLAVGSMVSTAEHVREKLKGAGFTCTLANGRFIKPVDYGLADRLAKSHELLVVLEENVLQGGYGLQVKAYVQEHYPEVQVLTIALPDAYVEHGNVSVLRQELGIDSDSVIRTMRKTWEPLEDAMKGIIEEKEENK